MFNQTDEMLTVKIIDVCWSCDSDIAFISNRTGMFWNVVRCRMSQIKSTNDDRWRSIEQIDFFRHFALEKCNLLLSNRTDDHNKRPKAMICFASNDELSHCRHCCFLLRSVAKPNKLSRQVRWLCARHSAMDCKLQLSFIEQNETPFLNEAGKKCRRIRTKVMKLRLVYRLPFNKSCKHFFFRSFRWRVSLMAHHYV